MPKPAEDRSPQPAEPSQDSSDSTELPDVPWVTLEEAKEGVMMSTKC